MCYHRQASEITDYLVSRDETCVWHLHAEDRVSNQMLDFLIRSKTNLPIKTYSKKIVVDTVVISYFTYYDFLWIEWIFQNNPFVLIIVYFKELYITFCFAFTLGFLAQSVTVRSAVIHLQSNL